MHKIYGELDPVYFYIFTQINKTLFFSFFIEQWSCLLQCKRWSWCEYWKFYIKFQGKLNYAWMTDFTVQADLPRSMFQKTMYSRNVITGVTQQGNAGL